MNEAQFAHRVRHVLNEGLELDAAHAARLRAARQQALAAYRPDPQGYSVLSGGAAARLGGLRGISLRIVLPAVILSVAFVATYGWQLQQRAAEIEELDAQLLTGDLPIDAYLDQGFAAWLKRRASQ
ncbi:MAG TPA: DUF3619 family protein [Burkholderiales bacterium]|nr:DUF3619 family protein [Burkholderiales bacterium]